MARKFDEDEIVMLLERAQANGTDIRTEAQLYKPSLENWQAQQDEVTAVLEAALNDCEFIAPELSEPVIVLFANGERKFVAGERCIKAFQSAARPPGRGGGGTKGPHVAPQGVQVGDKEYRTTKEASYALHALGVRDRRGNALGCDKDGNWYGVGVVRLQTAASTARVPFAIL